MAQTTHNAAPATLPARLPRLLLILAVLAAAFFFAWLTITRYTAFESRALDMGNLNQAIWNTAHGRWFLQTNQPGVTNRLSLHVEPILLPLALLYRLWQDPRLLLVIQAVVVACGALPLHALALHKLNSRWLALLFALGWLAMPAMQGATWIEFHPVTLAPTFLLAAFYFLVTGRSGWYALFAVLAAACKEELGLLVAMLGVYAIIALPARRRVGWITVVFGLGWSLFAVLVIQRQFGGNYHWGRYDYLGGAPAEMVRTLFTQPGILFAQLGKAESLRYVYQLLLPVGFLALLAPEVLLLALPSLGINLLADYPPMQEVNTLQYAAPIAPFVALAAVMGAARLLAGTRRSALYTRLAATAIGALLIAGIVLAQRAGGYFPGGANYRLYTVTEHHRRAQTLIDQIAPTDRVTAQDKLNPHVSGREISYIFPRVSDSLLGDADTALLDVTGPAWPQHPNDLHRTVQDLLGSGWGVAAADDGYLLLRKGAASTSFPASFYTPWQMAEASPLIAQAAVFGDEVALLGLDVIEDAHGEVVVRSYWQALRPLERTLHFDTALLDASGAPLFDSRFYQPVVTLWYPSELWQPGKTVVVESLPWSVPAGGFALQVGVWVGEQAQAQRLPVQGVAPATPVLNRSLRVGSFVRARDGWQVLEPASDPEAMDARIGTVNLTGARVSLTGRTTSTVTLEWAAAQVQTVDDNVFVHVLDEAGTRVAQLDTQPRSGLAPLPLTAWPAGYKVSADYVLALPADLPAGRYSVVAGLYDWRDGVRRSVTGQSAAADNAVIVGAFELP